MYNLTSNIRIETKEAKDPNIAKEALPSKHIQMGSKIQQRRQTTYNTAWIHQGLPISDAIYNNLMYICSFNENFDGCS